MGDPDQTDDAAGDDDTIRNQTPPDVAARPGQPEDVSAADAPASDAGPAASSPTPALASPQAPAPASPRAPAPASPQAPAPASSQAPPARARAASAESHVRVDARLLEAALLNLRKRVAAIPLVFEIAGSAEVKTERAKLLSQIDDYLLPRVRRSAAP
ncbi:MAG TPA: hypothetical protein VKG61_02140, partial [Streptosporangiaceae bacterium]|nr:hypothetical protein [Streptosporangiaceae bacterium]